MYRRPFLSCASNIHLELKNAARYNINRPARLPPGGRLDSNQPPHGAGGELQGQRSNVEAVRVDKARPLEEVRRFLLPGASIQQRSIVLPVLISIMEILFILAGAVVGFIIGLTGIGGRSLMTPILVLGFAINPAIAVDTDLLYAAII